MLQLETNEDVKNYLISENFLSENSFAEITKLSGGVSNNVWKIVFDNNRWILKQALGKLKVNTDWFSDVERIHREHDAMRILNNILPANSVPQILHTDEINHTFIMSSANEGALTWKEILMNGKFDADIAAEAGKILKAIHVNSEQINKAGKEKLKDQKYFIQLRVEPFHQYLIQKYPSLEKFIQRLIDEVTQKRICFVHGDFSPKNMLIEKNNHLLLIDFEVVHWGNPVFDVAYCLGHLMLKGWHLKRKSETMNLIETFLNAYNKTVENLIPHLGLMLLARMDGKSPVDYIKDEALKNGIRSVALGWIREGEKENNILSSIKNAYKIN
jgi:5-methylthioribose kinase